MTQDQGAARANPVIPAAPPPPRTPEDKSDLSRGVLILLVLILLTALLVGYYIYLHNLHPKGLLAPTEPALDTVASALLALEAEDEDILNAGETIKLKDLSTRLDIIAPQIGLGDAYRETMTRITAELDAEEAHRSVLLPLFDQVGYLIRVGPSSYFWSGSLDRWIEMVFWTVIGTLVFLLSEIKKYYPQEYQKIRDFKKFTPWYAANLFRGPFISLVILLALTTASIDALGITVDIHSASIEVLITLAAILGYFSRVADKQIEIIAEKLLPEAWKKANPPPKTESSISGETVETPAAPEEQPQVNPLEFIKRGKKKKS